MEQDKLLLAFDIGTTAVKGGVYTTAGKCLFSGAVAYAKVSAQAGWVEQNPADWTRCMAALLQRAGQHCDLERVAATAICSQVNTHVFVDKRGRALANAIVWEDQRCAGVAQQLNREVPAGLGPLDASSLVCRAAWIKRFRPQIWHRTHCILSPKDYCILQLTGEWVTDALSSVGLVDSAGNYLNDLLALVDGLPQRLPAIRPVDQLIGEVRDNAWDIAGCPVVTGTMDCWASLFGSGAFAAGKGFQVAGTSEILGLVAGQRGEAAGVVSFPVYRHRYLYAGPTQAGGDALTWFAGAQGSSVEALLSAVGGAASHSGPLLFLPYLMGERAPIWDAKARGAFIGLNKHHRQACMTRAIMEGVAFSARHLLEPLQAAAGFHCGSLAISGGASRSDLGCQVKADIMNRSLRRVENIDTGVFGAALMAATGIGVYQDLDEAAAQGVLFDRSFEPRAQHRDRYDSLYRIYRQSYRQLRPVFEDLYRLGGS